MAFEHILGVGGGGGEGGTDGAVWRRVLSNLTLKMTHAALMCL